MPIAFLPSVTVQIHLVLAGLLVYVVVDDLRNYRVRNDVILAIVALFVLSCVVQWDWTLLKAHLALGAILFAVLLFLYSRGWMGGGDVKLLVAAFLWLGPSNASIFVVALTVFATLYGTAAKFMLVPAKYAGGQTKVPYAPSIALAWLLTIAVTTW
jgi:prepilin peptidase CpaA